jgi:hypothetical protein
MWTDSDRCLDRQRQTVMGGDTSRETHSDRGRDRETQAVEGESDRDRQ